MKTRSSVQLSTEAWLIRGISHGPGELKLAYGRLSFTAYGSGILWKFQLNKLERDASRPGLADRMRSGENSVVFELPISDVEVDFPWYSVNSCLRVKAGGVRYLFTFSDPSSYQCKHGIGGILKGCQAMVKCWPVGKAWKNVLSEQSN
jgi:hypothetical protein